MIVKTPLEKWIARKIDTDALTRKKLEEYQLEAINNIIDYAKENSAFYKEKLKYIEPLKTPEDIKNIPFTTPEDISEYGYKMICVTQNEIERIVTLETSGTTAKPKRIFFTKSDQELTIDFFHHGMSTFTRHSDRVLILLPGQRPGSVGDLLKKGLERLGAAAIIYGIVDDPKRVLDIIQNENINVIVGIPQQVLTVSQISKRKNNCNVKIHSVLLSTDYVPDSIVKRLRQNFRCEVYEHYGLTETGLGGGVFCKALCGYHMREADLYFEIVDHNTGLPLPDGEHGEVVFTTLTRKGMPLIRYRTGDIARFKAEPCPCGTVLKTMEKIKYRITSSVCLKDGYRLNMPLLEEAVFKIDRITDFDAELISDNQDLLKLNITSIDGMINEDDIIKTVINTELGRYIQNGQLKLQIGIKNSREPDIKAVKKRKIIYKG